MKWFRSRVLLPACGAAAALALYADLPAWLQHVPAVLGREGVFFRTEPMPGGPVAVRRPPAESRAELTKLIAAAPADAELHALRARASEEQLDFTSAEQDWLRYAELAPDKGAGQLALADFYHRRLRPDDELRALAAAAAQPTPPQESLRPAQQQRSWRAFERAVALVEAQALPVETGLAQFRAWIARYPQEQAAYMRFFDYALAHKRFDAASEVIAAHEKAFPEDAVFPVSARARIEESRGSVEQALAVYDSAFEPLWPPELVKEYFGLLERTRNLRRFLERARAALAANPNDLNAAVRIFYYYQQQGNLPAAQRTLIEFRSRRQAQQAALTAEELWILARLFEATQQYEEAVRNYYDLYTLAGSGADAERALAGIIRALFTAPEQPIRFGAGDLSFYRDVATMDPHPGFLNGILSLLLNSTYPQSQFAEENRASAAYFHRVRAAELLELFDSRFPTSAQRPALLYQLVSAYATYGDSEGVIRGGRRFLAAFPQASQRTAVALLMADAFARKNDEQQEFAVYDALLKELAAQTKGAPLREPEYQKVLNRYVARLVSLKRPLDALPVLRQEIDRNPNDEALYERLAAFLQQNRLDAEVEQVYRRAIRQFDGTSWYDRLARWYLRRKQMAEFQQLTREVVDIFSGSDLERYFREVVSQGVAAGAAMYLQVNLYAHQRFPNNLVFVRNLLNAYTTRGTADPAAWQRLLRRYWYFDDNLRATFFRFLAGSRQLDAELNEARNAAPGNLAAVRFVAEAEAWRSHFEQAAPGFDALAAQHPADEGIAGRAAALNRSLAAFDQQCAARAVAIEEKLHQFAPRNSATLTRIGEIYAGREEFDSARPYWNRIAAIEPGKPDGYLEAATIFWDYFLYDDALRLIEEGRAKLGNPSLFAYEAGAIYENKRDYTRAVAEYMKGAASGSSARARLLQLSRRTAQQALVEKLTIERASGANPDPAAVALRTAVLEAQNRRDELRRFLIDVAGRTSSMELLETIRNTASRAGLDEAEERALERQIAVTGDPVERMRLRLALMRFYEGRREVERARRAIEALYKQNPEISGVVRATVDFYWRNKMERQAIDVLRRAIASAADPLRKQFMLEAARKSTESGDIQGARQLLDTLLKAEPHEPIYLAAMAETYARQGDDRGLRDFYTRKIGEIKDQNLRTTLRRGLIPVLTRQKDYVAAIDQYIEIIKTFPEDEGVVREAASYASAHGGTDRVRGYFAKATADSPRDYRWPMILARLNTFFEDIPAAITAYGQAIAIRPDRVDLHIARASLQERLMRFDDALGSYRKIYELTYRDPHWMRKSAEVYARRGQADAAVKALREALSEGRPERPEPFFEAARILDSWNLLDAARRFAERGVELAGVNLLADRDYITGAQTYARVMTRLRAHEEAYARLGKLAVDDTTRSVLSWVLAEMSSAVSTYFTPEEKASFEAFLSRQTRSPSLIEVAGRAGLHDFEARRLFEQMMMNPGKAPSQEQRLSQLQKRRMEFSDLAHKLLAYWNVHPPAPDRDRLLVEAAQAYRLAGDEKAELSALTLKQRSSALEGDPLQRYLELLLRHDPQRVVALAEAATELERNAAANAAMASGDPALALRAVAARGNGMPPVWTSAYTGLTGLYYAGTGPSVEDAFRDALGAGTLGERLGKPVDRTRQLAGSIWFYYGTAYGAYRAAKKTGDPEDYLPALLEGAPASANVYVTLADYYRETGQPGRALADYAHAVELDPNRGDIEGRMAEVLWDEGRRDEAVAHWKAAFAAFRRLLDGRIPETFWGDVERLLQSVGQRKLLPQVRQEADAVLRTYIRRNGGYRAEPLLRAAYDAGGIDWVIDLVRAAAQPLPIYTSIVDARWLPEAAREQVYRQILDAAAAQAAQATADYQYRQQELRDWRLRWIGYLADTKLAGRAQTELEALPEDMRMVYTAQLLEIRIAAQRGTLAALIERYGREPDKAPSFDLLRNAAALLRKNGDDAGARRVLEFAYTRELDRRNFSSANFLGLAELRLETGDTAAAVTLLRRMTLVAGEPFEDLVPAADLLNKYGRTTEARQFLSERVKAVPWDFAARVKLGDAAVAAAPEAPYALRAQAALLKPSGKAGSAELDLLASGAVAPAAAEQPFFYHARIEAARTTSDAAARIRLLRNALAIDPNANEARLALFRAALAGGEYQTALSSMEPMLHTVRSLLSRPDPGEGAAPPYLTGMFLAETGLDERERGTLAEGLGLASEKVGRPGAAIVFYRMALALEPTQGAREALDRLRAEQDRRARDAQRRPAISKGLEQERLVRPRLNGGAQ